MIAETAELVATLSLKDQLSVGARRAQTTLRNLDQSFQRTQRSLTTTSRNLKALGLGLAGAGIASFKFAADFEEQLATINTVAKVTPERLDAIGESIKQMAMDTGTSIDDLSSAYYDLVSAGVDAADAQEVLTQANKLAIGGLSTTNEAVDLLTTAINSYGLEATDAKRITDGFAQSIAAGKVTAAQLAQSFARVAPIAASAGIGIDELQAAYAQLTAQGVPAAEVSTQVRAAIVALQRPTEAMSDLQERLNVNFEEMARDRGLAETYQLIRREADKQGISMVELTGRLEGTQFALGVTGRNAARYAKNLQDVRKSSDGAGVAQQQFAERQRTVNAAMRRLRETARTLAMDFGEGLLPGANKGLKALGDLLRARRKDVQRFGDSVGQVVEKFFTGSWEQGADQGSARRVNSQFEDVLKTGADALAAVPWDTIKQALTVGGQVAKTALDLFNNMPKPVQDALIAIAAVNKLGGGIATSIIKDLAGLALSSLKTITAGNVTVIGANITSPGGGGGTVPGPQGGKTGGGGGIGGALANVAKLLPWVAAIATIGEENKGLAQSARDKLEEIRQSTQNTQSNTRGLDSHTAAILQQAQRTANLQPVQNDILNGIAKDAQATSTRILQVPERINPRLTHVGNIVQSSGKAMTAEQRRTRGEVNQVSTSVKAGARQTTSATTRGAEKTAAEVRRDAAIGKLQANAALRAIPVLGSVRSAVSGVQSAIRQKDLSVRVNNVVNVSARQVAHEVERYVGNGGRTQF